MSFPLHLHHLGVMLLLLCLKEQSSASIKSFFIESLSSIFGSQVERLVPEYPLPIVHAKKLRSKYLFRADIVIP